jgi:ribonuclease P protein component
MMRFGFPRRARILREREFRRVYRGGSRLAAFPLRFCALQRRDGPSRLGLAVSRKVGNAVARNRWKRAVREVFRHSAHRLRAPCDVVVAVAWEAVPSDVTRVPEAFERLIAWANAGKVEAPGQ